MVNDLAKRVTIETNMCLALETNPECGYKRIVIQSICSVT